MRKRAGKPDEREKERGAREERTALLSASSNIPRATPSFLFARGPRRFCRLNAINDLIPVITVLIYRARGGSDFLRLCVGGFKMEKEGEVADEVAEEESFFSSCEQQSRDQLDLTDKTTISLFVVSSINAAQHGKVVDIFTARIGSLHKISSRITFGPLSLFSLSLFLSTY